MNFAEFTIRNRVLSVIVILMSLIGGWNAYQYMPRLEDPDFTIREAQVITYYPGATPTEVAEEVSETLEVAIRQLQEVEEVRSVSSFGKSEITVEIKYEFSKTKAALSTIWSKLRNKVSDNVYQLPPGAQEPIVADDFGDVYGMYYLLTGNDYNYGELLDYAKDLKSELEQIDNVAKVTVLGDQTEAIFVEFNRETLRSLGLSLDNITSKLAAQNQVVNAGNLQVGQQRLVIAPSGAVDSIQSLKNTLVSDASDGKTIFLRDIADVYRGFKTPPESLLRFNQQKAIALGISNVLGSNVVAVGKALDARIAESESRRPWGMQIQQFYHQGQEVEASVENFVANVIAALVIVVITLLLFMGLQSSLVIGAILLLTIAATLATMEVAGIPMHRISLGALIIALGMMVDNAIVVTEGILVGIKRGIGKLQIAKEIVTQTQWPLLGGTIVGCLAFAPIGFAPGSTAEYTGHLFWVILISLLYSWLFAVTLTPWFCYLLFKDRGDAEAEQEKVGAVLGGYKSLVRSALKHRVLTLASVIGLFVLSLWGAQFIKPGFFPTSTSPQLVVDYWLPEGTDISRTEADIKQIETFVAGLDGVESIESSVGAGGLRYMLVYAPQSPNSSYGQLLIRVDDYKRIDDLIPTIRTQLDQEFVDAQTMVWRFVLGPGGGADIEATFTGPDPDVLRNLADQAKAIMAADGRGVAVRDDWRAKVPMIVPHYDEQTGQRAGISRQDLAKALQTNFNGREIGTYREADKLLPIISRAPAQERQDIANIGNVQVIGSATASVAPLSAVTTSIDTQWRDAQLRRVNRVWTIKAQVNTAPDELESDLRGRISAEIEAIELPDGYSFKWEGIYGDSTESNEDLASTIPLGLMAMVIVVLLLFNAVKQPVVIWLVVPLAFIGVVLGLVLTETPLEFMGILGLLSLSGLLIKNAIVLVDQIDVEIDSGKPRFDAIIDASVSRLRPVMMGALTTVLGVIPLFFDAFFKSMSVVMVFGLTFATVLTLVIVPVLYSVLFRIDKQESAHSA
ncbi:efflux RND transporter permease subunit [uncultured Ferrimonas sp.]|uniref:efflux RND transporter permease subunit n=1 Tax=uncultured Ferrimonas sp. TaxID=432640 RepID=UPI00260F848B|nr:efflux RND transporter permease subunit [uncultured Ferrimonas sp.]